MEKLYALELMVIAIGAYFMPHISKKLTLPSAVGEFFFGMLVGTFILKSGSVSIHVEFLSELGFLILMYMAGLELDFDRLTAMDKQDVVAYGGYAIILAGLSVLLVKVLNMNLFFSLILLTSAIGLLVAVLKELNMFRSGIGQTMIILGVIGEVITLAGITFVSLTSKAGTTKETVTQLLGLVGFVVAIVLVLKILKLVLWWNPEKKGFFMSVGNPSEIGIRANLLNLFVFVAIASFVGLEAILGAFFGGAIFAMIFAERESMLERLSGFGYGFLIPIFFIEVGTRFRLSDFTTTEVLKNALILMTLIFVVRCVATIPLLLTKIPKLQLLYIPLSQSFPLTLLVAAAAIGESTELISKDQSSSIILTAIITAIIFPWLIKLLYVFVPVEE